MFVFHPTVTDNVGLTKLEGLVNGKLLGGGCPISAGRTLCKLTLSSVPDDTDATITLRASDAAGNQSEKSVRLHVDNVAPTETVSPARGSSMRSGPATVTVNGVPADTAKVVMLDGSTQTELASRAEAPWTFTWDAVDNTVSPWFVITDRAGNPTTRSSDYIVDDEAPVIQRVDFAGAYSTNRLDTGTGWAGASSILAPTIQDESLIARSEWWVNGVLTSTDPSFSWNAGKVAASAANVELRVWDAAGNTSSKAFRVGIDKAAPATTVYPAERSLIRGTTYVTSIKASDPHGIAYTDLISPATPTTRRATSSMRAS